MGISLVQAGECVLREGRLGAEARGQLASPWEGGGLQRGVLCSVRWGGRRWGCGPGGGRGQWEQSEAVQSQRKAAPGMPEQAARRGHCSSSEDSCEMPSSSSFSSFLGLPLGFLPGAVVVFRVLAAPLFLLPFGRPRGLLGVGTSLGSFGGCLRGLPRPRFSVPSFSCLEAKGWLAFELDSLIFPLCRAGARATAGMRELGRRPAVRAPGLPGATVLGAEDRPGSAAAAGSKCGCLLGAAPAPEIAPARSPN